MFPFLCILHISFKLCNVSILDLSIFFNLSFVKLFKFLKALFKLFLMSFPLTFLFLLINTRSNFSSIWLLFPPNFFLKIFHIFYSKFDLMPCLCFLLLSFIFYLIVHLDLLLRFYMGYLINFLP